MKKMAAEEKRELQRSRIRSYFLEAAKEIIAKEGHESVSVRRVADMAGYSYATIYNYFEDLNGMLWEVKNIMIQDIFVNLMKKMPHKDYDMAEMKKGFRVYISFFIENPNIFRFFFFHPLEKPETANENTETGPDFAGMWQESFRGLIAEGRLREEDVEAAASTIIYSLHGLIMLYFVDKTEMNEEKVYLELDKILDFIL